MQSFSLVPANYGIELLSEVEELKTKLNAVEKEKAQLIQYIQALEDECNSAQLKAAQIKIQNK